VVTLPEPKKETPPSAKEEIPTPKRVIAQAITLPSIITPQIKSDSFDSISSLTAIVSSLTEEVSELQKKTKETPSSLPFTYAPAAILGADSKPVMFNQTALTSGTSDISGVSGIFSSGITLGNSTQTNPPLDGNRHAGV
jgi:hypothetical protein